jgi:ABC-type dipeptide/oligopeptide/nickel transport system permease component
MELVFGANLIITVFSLPIGVFAAIYPRHWFARVIMGVSIIGLFNARVSHCNFAHLGLCGSA